MKILTRILLISAVLAGGMLLAAPSAQAATPGVKDQAGFFSKEAVTKATGDGIRAAFSEVVVAADGGLPRVADWPYPRSPRDVSLFDLDAAAGYVNGRMAIWGGWTSMLLNLGAAFGSAKVWAPERAVEFCRRLRDGGGSPVPLGAAGDAPGVEAVRAAARAPSLVGRDRPELLPALLTELDALVAGDTGVAHLAAALGTPVVALFGPTDPALSAPRGPVALLSHPVPCAPCFYRTCPIDHPCMRLLAAERVRERLETLLGAHR